ncbi:MAG TPA: sigma-70 family RNA polymerase sigma factor [Candidatus Eisenbergiella merdavium]|uniref:Sigma-70 family RNA polymerase sigma factor n=1 Tax=Candidatus Eisenbergiella merdavium TaxID=2838551 RepID=A0A9D2SNU7_9FIRM|nr:sigma-70 family RNA polymerase sigma factor [Candidatus Eisenbergiella merdavium]
MKNMHELTAHQALYAEEHIGLVHHFLHRKGLKEEDYYDIIIFGYLQAVQEYDENPCLADYSFATIAWKRMQDVMNEYFRSQNRLCRKASFVYPDSRQKDGLSLDELLPDRGKDLQEQTADRLLTLEIISFLTETEQRIVQLKSEGFTHREIARIFHTTAHGISDRLYRMRIRLAAMSCCFEQDI